MNDPKHAQLMLEMAAADLQAIRNMLDRNQFAEAVFGFQAGKAYPPRPARKPGGSGFSRDEARQAVEVTSRLKPLPPGMPS